MTERGSRRRGRADGQVPVTAGHTAHRRHCHGSPQHLTLAAKALRTRTVLGPPWPAVYSESESAGAFTFSLLVGIPSRFTGKLDVHWSLRRQAQGPPTACLQAVMVACGLGTLMIMICPGHPGP